MKFVEGVSQVVCTLYSNRLCTCTHVHVPVCAGKYKHRLLSSRKNHPCSFQVDKPAVYTKEASKAFVSVLV